MTGPAVKQRLRAILAADAAGFSRLMAQDEHATVTALDAARQVFRAQIEAQQGRVIDMAGDSVLAVFETATGAVAAALAVQQELATASAGTAPERRMHFRIGVHLGDVIEKPDGTVYGDGVNVAARLEGLAQPGGITVSDSVRGVVSGRVVATFTDQGEQTLKNIGRPIRAFAIDLGLPPAATNAATAQDQASQASRSRRSGDGPPPLAPATAAESAVAGTTAPRAAPRPSSLFVGRQQELAQLGKALDSARQGRGRVVLLAGSGGMGKTRLAQQLAAQAEAQGVPVLWGRCLEEPGAPPYWPWRQLIRSYLRAGGDADPAHTLGAEMADIAGIVPEVAEQFGVPPRQAEAGDNAQSRFRLFDAVTGFWRRASQRAPLLLIFEDLHFADATSLRLFGFLANELDDSRLLVLGTYRDTELSRQHPLFETLAELARSAAFQRIQLAGLSSRETEEFLAAASGGTTTARWVSALHARTEGHPLFLEETLRFMMEGRNTLALDPAGDDPRLLTAIPSGVREVIGKRLNRLSTCGQPGAVDRRMHRPQLRPGVAGAAGGRQVGRRGARIALKRRWPCIWSKRCAEPPVSLQPCADPRNAVRRDAGPAALTAALAHWRIARAASRRRRCDGAGATGLPLQRGRTGRRRRRRWLMPDAPPSRRRNCLRSRRPCACTGWRCTCNSNTS